MSDLRFVYVTYIATTPQKLWEALTSSEYTEKYFFGSKIQSEWQEGSHVSYSRNEEVTDYGVVLKYEPYSHLSFTWNRVGETVHRKEPSQVNFKIDQMNSVIKLTLTHERLIPSDLSDKEDTFEGLNNGWPAILSNLKSLLETGHTLPPIAI